MAVPTGAWLVNSTACAELRSWPRGVRRGGDTRLVTDQCRGLWGFLRERGSSAQRAARTEVRGRAGGIDADRDGPGRGVPVRLVRCLALESGVGTGRAPVLLGRLVVVAGADLVVRGVDRPGAHL